VQVRLAKFTMEDFEDKFEDDSELDQFLDELDD